MKNWIRQHGVVLRQTLVSMLRQPVSTVFNLSVIGITAAFPLTLWLIIHSLSGLISQLPVESQLTIFLKKGTFNVAQLREQLIRDSRVANIVFIPQDDALQQMESSIGIQDLLAGLTENPLPDALILTSKDNNPDTLNAIQKELKNNPSVDEVQLDSAWARKLAYFITLCQTLLRIIVILLALTLSLITANTIRMQILTRLDEIEVAKLIGATDSFIYRPFIYFSILQGLLGGVLGCGIAATIIHFLNLPIGALAKAYNQPFALRMPEIMQMTTLCAITITLSLLGGWTAVWRHLRKFL